MGAGYSNLGLLARSTPSVDMNIPSTSEKRKKTCSSDIGSASLVLCAPSQGTAGSVCSLATHWHHTLDGCRQKEEPSSGFAKGHAGAWEQQRAQGRARQACGFEHRRSSDLKGHGRVRAHPTSTIRPLIRTPPRVNTGGGSPAEGSLLSWDLHLHLVEQTAHYLRHLYHCCCH